MATQGITKWKVRSFYRFYNTALPFTSHTKDEINDTHLIVINLQSESQYLNAISRFLNKSFNI